MFSLENVSVTLSGEFYLSLFKTKKINFNSSFSLSNCKILQLTNFFKNSFIVRLKLFNHVLNTSTIRG